MERGALETAAWYLADRVWKRRGARAAAGGRRGAGPWRGAALPLLDLTGVAGGAGRLGVSGAAAGRSRAWPCDRFFGLTSGWMRDVATAQAVQRRLQVLQFDWASESVREVLGPTEGTASEAAERCLGVLRRFSEDVTELVRAETADWMVEFRTGARAAGHPVGWCRRGRREVRPSPRAGSRAAGPGARPNMPRQRPPEPR